MHDAAVKQSRINNKKVTSDVTRSRLRRAVFGCAESVCELEPHSRFGEQLISSTKRRGKAQAVGYDVDQWEDTIPKNVEYSTLGLSLVCEALTDRATFVIHDS